MCSAHNGGTHRQFGGKVLPFISIIPLYEGKVTAIDVRTYEPDIIELNGKAYIRSNGEILTLSDTLKRQILSRRSRQDKS